MKLCDRAQAQSFGLLEIPEIFEGLQNPFDLTTFATHKKQSIVCQQS